MRRSAAFVSTMMMLAVAARSRALTIVSGPSFTPSTNAPLAGLLQLTTDEASRVSVSVNDGTTNRQIRFYDYATTHAVPLLGFKAGRTNQITVTVYDRYRNQFTAAQPVTFVTAALPANFPIITVLQSQPARMEPGYTLVRAAFDASLLWYVMIFDSAGQVVWYDVTQSTADIRQLDNGDLFMPAPTNFTEINLLGQTVSNWPAPPRLAINIHDGVPTDHGTILYLSTTNEVVTNYPTSVTDPSAPTESAIISFEKVVEISATNSSLLNTWSPINVLDPRRISYLVSETRGVWDSEHCNAIIEDPSDPDGLIVSMRHQNAVVKISRATGQLRWILGPPDNWGAEWQPYLLTPVGSPFFWQYGQHAPVFTPQGTLIMNDNGNFRASPFAPPVADTNNYSRAVEYSINEQTMEVSQVWDYGRTNATVRLYSDHEGNAEPEPKTGNVLIDFAAVSYVNGVPPSSYGVTATESRITEVTHEAIPQIVFDVSIAQFNNPHTTYKDENSYRCHRIADLYAHLPQPVGDLSVTFSNGTPLLQFSADDALTYVVQGSSNLLGWQTIGAAVEDAQQDGNFSFADSAASGARYYRIVTQ